MILFRKAVLIIHGFGGGPYDLEYLTNMLEVNRKFDTYTFTLPGHDVGIGTVDRKDWVKSVDEHMEMLINYGYKDIYVIGHSMGGVLASYVASKYKEVKKLVLLAPAFHYLNFNGKLNNVNNIIDSLRVGTEVMKEYKDELLGRFLKLPRNALIQFVEIVRDLYDTPKFIKTPTLIIEGTKDNVVPFSSALYVYDSIKSKKKSLVYVKDVNHDLIRSKRKEEITSLVIKFLKSSKRMDDKKEI